MTDLNIYQRINEVRKKVEYLRKQKDVNTGKGKYKVVTHDQVTAELRQYLIEFGIVVVPSLTASKMHNDIIKFSNSVSSRYDATYCFEFVNIDKPEDKAIIVIEAHAIDNGDKAPGKAISYATKYALLKMFNIETGEDEESIIQNRISSENAMQELYNSLTKVAKESGMNGLEQEWLLLTEDDRKLLGIERLKVLKNMAAEHDNS